MAHLLKITALENQNRVAVYSVCAVYQNTVAENFVSQKMSVWEDQKKKNNGSY